MTVISEDHDWPTCPCEDCDIWRAIDRAKQTDRAEEPEYPDEDA